MIVLRVTGIPAPKGSSRAMLIGGRAVHVPGGSSVNRDKIASWKQAVVDAYNILNYPIGLQPLEGPVVIGAIYRFPLRKGDLRTDGQPKQGAPFAHTSKPDRDKLDRATLDALTAAGAWRDDAQAAIGLSAKVYVPVGMRLGADLILDQAGAVPGAMTGYVAVANRWHDELVELQRALFEAITAPTGRSAA